MRLGIFGGTFNPPHLGHLICAQEAHLQLGLDAVMLMPARIPPHKAVDDEPGPGHRLELCRLAAAGDARLDVSDLEMGREGPSYTVDTLKELHSQTPDTELFLIVGGDVAAGLPSWRDPERVLALATAGGGQTSRSLTLLGPVGASGAAGWRASGVLPHAADRHLLNHGARPRPRRGADQVSRPRPGG